MSTSSKTWISYLREEIDASYLYMELAQRTSDPKEKKSYVSLSDVEKRHVQAWEKLLSDEGVSYPKNQPSSKARLMVWLTRFFGTDWLRQMMLREESKEVKSYISLYKQANDSQTKNIALRLARDSASHAQTLSNILGKDQEPWHKTDSGSMLRDVVYGFNDGLTANFGLIAAMIGAQAAAPIILVTGVAGLIADALSMGSSCYLAAKSEQEVYENERQMEADEIKYMPELETEELALIYENRGMDQDAAKSLAVEVMKDKDKALEEKVKLELGFSDHAINPMKEAWLTGIATAIGALIPVLPFFIWQGRLAIWISFAFAMLAHFGVGAARSIVTGRGLFRSGFDMFIVGFGVAGIGYLFGELVLNFL